jgi:hypothetical protein
MNVNARWKVPLWVGAFAVVLTAGYVAVDALRSAGPTAPVADTRTEAPAAPPPSPPTFVSANPAVPRAEDGGLDLVKAAMADVPPESEDAPPRSPVDLERIRVKLPDNLFWETGAPTKDPAVLQKRAQAERQWNEAFGKVQAGEASPEEIHRYFEHKRKLSEDYIALAQGVLTEYGDTLPEQDRGLYELSIRMHTTRLQELPRQEQDALARREAQAQRQREWKQRGGGGN